MKCHRDPSHCRLQHHKGRLSAKYNQIQSSAAVLRLEWHTNCFSTTHSESVPSPNSEYKDGRDCPLVNEDGSIPHPFRSVKDCVDAPSGYHPFSLGRLKKCMCLYFYSTCFGQYPCLIFSRYQALRQEIKNVLVVLLGN